MATWAVRMWPYRFPEVLSEPYASAPDPPSVTPYKARLPP